MHLNEATAARQHSSFDCSAGVSLAFVFSPTQAFCIPEID
jgi:hypothetical protein